jgi:hypothetical protein
MSMSTHQFARCKAIMRDLIERPLNASFLKPVDPHQDRLDGYFDIVTRPMDLGTIEAKLTTEGYDSCLDWYNDVCLVYENALLYHRPGLGWYEMAQYNLAEFKKMAHGFGCPDAQQWFNLVTDAMRKLKSRIMHGPVPQAIDPMIPAIIAKAQTMLPPTPQLIADVVHRINAQLEDDVVKFDVRCLLAELQPELRLDAEKVTVDADSLSDWTLNALSLYLKSHG